MPKGERRYYGRTAKVGLFWGFAGQGASAAVALGSAMVMARLLSPHEFGVAAVAYFFMQLSGRLTHFGFNAAIVRMKALRPEHLSSVFWFNLLAGAGAWAILAASAPALGAFFNSPEAGAVLPVAGLTFVLSAVGSVPRTLLSREMRFARHTMSEWTGLATQSVVAVGLAWAGFSFWSIIYGQLVGDFTRSVGLSLAAGWRPTASFSLPALRELLSFGSGIYAKGLLEYASQNLDNLIVGRLLGMSALGFYDKAFGLVSKTIVTVQSAGPAVSFRIFALIHEDDERFRRAYRKVALSVTMLGYPMLSAMIVVAPQLIEVLFGARWLPAALPFQVLCGAGMARLLVPYASSATQAKGQIWPEVRRQALFTLMLVVSVTVLSPWGTTGAAIGVLVSALFMNVMLHSLVHRQAGLAWRDLLAPQLPAVMCSLTVVVLVLVSQAAVRLVDPGSSAWVVLPLSGAVAAVGYVCFLFLSPYKDVPAVVFETLDDLAPGIAKRLDSIGLRPALSE